MEEMLYTAKHNMIMKETLLSKYACNSEKGIYLKKEDKEADIRPIFFRDIDRIIHSSAYTRYIDKTQVYSFIKNDHITHRVLHVQLVSKIARTIGRSLKLNEDLIEAISLGHDVGHTPFGHKGEKLLNSICEKENIGYFYHNGQSVRVLKDLEELNISLQTLDGILAHNGEILIGKYEFEPNKKASDFLEELDSVYDKKNYSKRIKPMTLEACVVRLSDIIAYIGRDIEDAIIVESIERGDIPKNIVKVLGDNNSKIVDTLIKDIIINSMDKPYLEFSNEVFESLMQLKEWNTKCIYESKEANKNNEIVETLFNDLFYAYLDKIENSNHEAKPLDGNNISSEDILFSFVDKRTKKSASDFPYEIKRIIIDYIAGQTDNFFLKECQRYIKNFNIELEELYN